MVDPRGKDGAAGTPKAESQPMRRVDKRHLDELLDEALEETFPASDSIALTADRE